MHSLLHAWDKDRDLLGARDVLVVDEAGMIGSRQMERLLSAAASAGAKVVLVGDPELLQAIEAGAAFRAIAERVGSVEITEVRRQHDVWQQQATRELATGRTAAALERYEAAGMVAGHDTLEAAKAAVVAGWDAVRRARPEASQIILAYRRDDVRDLNEQARAVRRAAGELVVDQVLATERGERAFATGDRLYFLRNERGLGVKNGTLGTLVAIEAGGERLTVRLDGPGGKAGGGADVTFTLRDYDHIDHGYAATVHKSQGVTVDQAHVLATGLMDRHVAYVGLTRHRDAVRLHWSADEIGSRDRLAQVLGRERLKDTSLDYELGGPGTAGTVQERDNLARAYGERRGVLMPVSEIVVPPPAPEQVQRVAAGRAGFRDRYAAHQQQRQQAAERDQQAHGLVRQWDGLVKDYTDALPGLGTDPKLDAARARLVAFGQEVRRRPDLVAVLRERDAEFGVAERPTLHGVLGHAQPERAIAHFLEVAESIMRRQQQDQVRQREAELDQARRPTRSRGPSVGM